MFILGLILLLTVLLILPAISAYYANYSSRFFEVDPISEKRLKGIQNALNLYCLSQADEFDCAPYYDGTPRKVGDIDGNSIINYCDYKLIQVIEAGKKKFNYGYGDCCIDVNADGEVEVNDAQHIMFYIMGRVDYFYNICE